MRAGLELLVHAEGDWVGVSEIARVTHSTCAHNIPHNLKKYYGLVYENDYLEEEGRTFSSYRALNWEEFLPLLSA